MRFRLESICSICQDDASDVVFHCNSARCDYCLCMECLRMAFNDGSGANSKECPMCQAPAALKMVEAACGTMAVKAVENEVRSSVEFDVKSELLVRKQKSDELMADSDEALKIFHKITEELNLKCPRCTHVFDDYEGCNALKCSCGAAFCALCLADCGQDAHEHIRQNHPRGMFSKDMFERAKMKRAQRIVKDELATMPQDREELIQLVKNHIDKVELLQSPVSPDTSRERIANFLRGAKKNLGTAIKSDRLSLISEQGNHRPISREMVSPRCSVPSDYRLTLTRLGEGRYSIRLLKENLGRWTLVDLEADNNGKDPVVDSLTNLKASLHCAVVAIEGERCLYQTRAQRIEKKGEGRMGDDEIAISFQRVDSNGDTANEDTTFDGKVQIVGLNPNRRIMLLQTHVNKSPESKLIATPVKHLIGAGNPLPLLDGITRPGPSTLLELNELQRCVADPLRIRTAVEVAGPPGSGKTKTITELTRSILGCTDFNVIVLSERNGAIDAIAEKFASNSMQIKNKKLLNITDVELWTTVLTFGSSGVGDFTKLFTLDQKLGHHPQLVALRTKIKEERGRLNEIAKQQRELLSRNILLLGRSQRVENTGLQSRHILNDETEDLSRPTEVINFLTMAHRNVKEIVSSGASRLTESIVDDLVDQADLFLGCILPQRTDREKRLSPNAWHTPERITDTMSILRALERVFHSTLQHELFDTDTADSMMQKVRALDDELKEREEHFRVELVRRSRLQMCTIGSCHKLPSEARADEDKITHLMDDLEIDSSDEGGSVKAVVIFDEAGCIPSYELLGLSRLECEVVALYVVGDVHQLPPYDPGSGNYRPGQGPRPEKMHSLLDVSFPATKKENRVMLTVQYRVPRDIADLLNHRIYRGNYQTPQEVKVPHKGFYFVNVPYVESKKYVNENEIEVVLELIQRSERKGYDSIIVLTPYKKQQREIQFRLRNMSKERVSVLTIDQCQGQEADIVILSLVRKPTRFLNKNRLNVALSRVREELYLLVDRSQLERASNDSGWECNLIARDLLSMG